jgi:hypothetical protein
MIGQQTVRETRTGSRPRCLPLRGYVENGKNFDSIVVGYYEGDETHLRCSRTQWVYALAERCEVDSTFYALKRT